MTLHVTVERGLWDPIRGGGTVTAASAQRRQLVYKALQNTKQMTRFDDVDGVNPIQRGRLTAGTNPNRGTGLWNVVVLARKRVLSEALCRHVVT